MTLIPERISEMALRLMLSEPVLLNLFPQDPDANRQWEERQREHRELVARYRARWLDDFYMSEVARLHGPSGDDDYYDSTCKGCDFEGWEADPPSWPCRTAQILIDRMENEPL